MTANQSPKQAGKAQAAHTRTVRAVTQPGGRNIDWKKIRAAGAVIAGMSILLGVRHRRWRYTHTAGVVLGIAAAAAARLKDKYVETPESK